MKLALRAAAERDLDEVFDHSVATHGIGSAERYLRDLQAGMDRLLDYPELGAAMTLRAGLRAYGVREHRIYYRIEADAVVVARVLHKAMDLGRHLCGAGRGRVTADSASRSRSARSHRRSAP